MCTIKAIAQKRILPGEVVHVLSEQSRDALSSPLRPMRFDTVEVITKLGF